ncbi:MAG: hypothetical protein UR17_C0001G0423 [Candidatus Woesebacteria bacterium GW2011_GWF1_31_35]|uniref:Uncharacterized protein n=1 Tax=Candidatus Woesebacteria bacterium GW2011_GWC2_31_9 TaxID=1618586 RepID=A0A0G0BKR9_9BACT|nr:MAG: hypothetical protein UR17_C0001G0423 [Candidatus Woesebacteria bacterium GW2011_GWF1_31_35]KKP23088.1 MAG: hypothetical protein UR11_C0001G0062 [Candidatus Woesebacteria bacterium GW2011_GWC1_30_29]KKP26776.1 MAG: hypothetical protein UR13_C0002G0011 [Candidatus Woesebacteria bacterium GW2011_GWD1_31_12]KKP27351.1 MAG: hypothetical protein UR16_C0003G0011 [Candidatus Woesebacteria bacterium GW2011_GWB1_31_29]KKP30747.1 MAG: hypothetical protein UR20_C0053G0003 [Candidatus Woesebacteria 
MIMISKFPLRKGVKKRAVTKIGLILITVIIVITTIILNIFFINKPKDVNNSQIKTNQELENFIVKKSRENCYSAVNKNICDSYHYIITIDSDKGNYAQGSIGIEGGSGGLWVSAKKNGKWDYLLTTNGWSDCKDVEIFPIGIFESSKSITDKCAKDGKFFDRSTGKFIN